MSSKITINKGPQERQTWPGKLSCTISRESVMCPIFSFLFLSLLQSAVRCFTYKRPIFRSVYVEVPFGVKWSNTSHFPWFLLMYLGLGQKAEWSQAPETRIVMELRRGNMAACPGAEGKGTVARGAGVGSSLPGGWALGGLHQVRPFQVRPLVLWLRLRRALGSGWPLQLDRDPRRKLSLQCCL